MYMNGEDVSHLTYDSALIDSGTSALLLGGCIYITINLSSLQ